MAGTKKRYGPAYLNNTVANLLNVPANTYGILTRVHLSNKDTSTRWAKLYVGVSGGQAGGTEIIPPELSIAVGDSKTFYMGMRLDVADYLTGLASVSSTIVVVLDYELYAL